MKAKPYRVSENLIAIKDIQIVDAQGRPVLHCVGERDGVYACAAFNAAYAAGWEAALETAYANPRGRAVTSARDFGRKFEALAKGKRKGSKR